MFNSALTFFGLTVLTISTTFAQLQDNRDKQMSCNEDHNGDRRVRKCDIREQTIASVRQLNVEPGRNGSVSIKGWALTDVVVRARMEAWAPSDSDASLLLSQVHSDASAGRIAASGPESSNNSNWSVSYEIFVPQSSDLKVTAFNGGISIRDITGRLELETRNGPLNLTRVAGDIVGKTINGPVRLEPFGNGGQGRQVELETKNGPVNISVPSNFQAHIQAKTARGPIQSDLGGVVADGTRRPGALDLNLGAGGGSFKVTTTNGPIRLARI